VFFGPIYPTIKIEDISAIVDTFAQYGATEIMVDELNLKPGIKDNVVEVFPPYKTMIGNTSYHQKLFDEIKRVCKEKNMKAINAF
jgi:hypothetical protein